MYSFEQAGINLVLGSKSPRRQELFRMAGIPVEMRTADVDESFPEEMPGEEVPTFLAGIKSDAIPAGDEEILITADTVVSLGDLILNKASDALEARAMLEALSNSDHWVHTGVCLRKGNRKHAFTESTRVSFRKLTRAEIDYYIREYQPFDKAGAYGIQEWIGLVGVERIEGCFFNVVGFPMSRFIQELQIFLREE